MVHLGKSHDYSFVYIEFFCLLCANRTGKTLLVKYICDRLKYNLVCIQLTDIVKGDIGTGELMLIELFQNAKKNLPPCIIFIDEFQALFTSKDSDSGNHTLSSTLMSCLDDILLWNSNAGSNHLITVIAATNEPWAIDKSFLRPGRFDRCIYVGPLNETARREMIVNALSRCNHIHHNLQESVSSSTEWMSSFELGSIVSATANYTGADMNALIRKCLIFYIQKQDINTPSLNNATNVLIFQYWWQALSQMQPSVTTNDILQYTTWKLGNGKQ